MFRPWVCVSLILAIPCFVAAGEKSWPGRYKNPPKTQGAAVLELWGHPEQSPAYGHTAVFSNDGKQALYASGGAIDPEGATDDSFLSLWDVVKAQVVRETTIPKAAVTALALAPDGRFAITGLVQLDGKGKENHRVTLWDLTDGKEVKTHDRQPAAVSALAFAPDGKKVLAVFENGLVRLFGADAAQDVTKNNQPALAVAFHPDGTRALIGCGELVKLWDLKAGKEVRAFKGHQGTVLAVAFSPDGKRVVSSADDVSVRLWDSASGKELGVLKKEPANSSLISVGFVDAGKKSSPSGPGSTPLRGHRSRATSAFGTAKRRRSFGRIKRTGGAWCLCSSLRAASKRSSAAAPITSPL